MKPRSSIRRWPLSVARDPGSAATALVVFLAAASIGVGGCSLFHSFNPALPPSDGAPKVGAAAPDFTLLDEHGTPFQLSSLHGKKTVLVFYRGFW